MVTFLKKSPQVVVTSRHADETLWAEALSLGAFDVLVAPANQQEFFRMLSSAWQNWKERHQPCHAASASVPASAG
jgi:FixJ family two-component response regulator